MRITSAIFAMTGIIWLIWIGQQILQAGFHVGAALVIVLPLALIYQAWELWNNRPNARKSGIATAVVVALGCGAELFVLSWFAEVPISITQSSPLQPALVVLWSGVLLYSLVAISLVLLSSAGPEKLLQRTRSEKSASER